MSTTSFSTERFRTFSRDLQGTRAKQPATNVGEAERWLSLAGGAALALYGLNRGTFGGLGLAAAGAALAQRGMTGHCMMYEAAGINTAPKNGPATSVPTGHGTKVEVAMTINRTPDELYRHWRDLRKLPSFMSHLQSVEETGFRSHWVAKAPLGMSVEWDAELINDKPGEMIAWQSLEGSEVDTAGSVHFNPLPHGRGTEVIVTLKYDPPAGKAGIALASLFGQSAESQIREDLRRFKQLVEAGEAPTIQGQSSCRQS